MDTVVLSGDGPTIRLKMGSDLHVSDQDPAPEISVLSNKGVKTVNISEEIKLKFTAA